MTRKLKWSLLLGNLLEHYDTSLYGLLSPFLAPLFFPYQDPLTALLLTYAIIPLSIIARPLGAIFFGYIADRYCRKKALQISLTGSAVATAAFGFIPAYDQVGVLAPLFLSLCRLGQSFFAAGEVVGGAIYLIENSAEEKKHQISSLFGSTTIGGIILASAAVSLFYKFDLIDSYWRILFLFGALTAALSLSLRQAEHLLTSTAAPHVRFSEMLNSSLRDCWRFRKAAVAIAFASGFSYTCYAIPFVMMNGFVPLVSTLSKEQMIDVNTLYLFVDLILLILFAQLSYRCNPEKMMIYSAAIAILAGLPLFWLMDGISFSVMLAVRLVFVVIGVAFSVPLYAWMQQQIPQQQRYTVTAFSYAIGSQLFGGTTSMFTLWIYQQTHSTALAACYWICLAFLCVKTLMKRMPQTCNSQ